MPCRAGPAGAEPATSADSNPCVNPMCSPQSAAPASTIQRPLACASTRSAATSAASPSDRRRAPWPRSAVAPAGYDVARVHDGHRDHHQRRRRVGKADVLRAQHQECFGEASQRQHAGDGDDDHVAARQAGAISASGGAGLSRRLRIRAVRFVDAEDDQHDREHRRHHGDPERRAGNRRRNTPSRQAPAAARRSPRRCPAPGASRSCVRAHSRA